MKRRVPTRSCECERSSPSSNLASPKSVIQMFPSAVKDQVRRLDIAMEHAPLVSMCERVCDLGARAERSRDSSARRSCAASELPEPGNAAARSRLRRPGLAGGIGAAPLSASLPASSAASLRSAARGTSFSAPSSGGLAVRALVDRHFCSRQAL